MIEVYKKEWELYLKRQLIIHMVVLFAGAATGFFILGIVLLLNPETAYVFLGTIFSMLFAGIYSFVTADEFNTRFILGVSFGQKRRNLILCELVFLVLLTVVSYAGILLFLVLEKNVYPIVFPGREAEGIQLFSFMPKWGILVIALVYLLVRMLFTLYMKYNGIVFGIIYVLGMTAAVLGSRFSWTGIIIDSILLSLSTLPVLIWVAAGIVSGIFVVLINSRIMMKIDVKY